MLKRTFYLALIFMGIFACSSSAELVGHWPFDEGFGTVVEDKSGNGYDGAIVNATWGGGKLGSALSFTADAYVETAYPGITGTASRTCCAVSPAVTASHWPEP